MGRAENEGKGGMAGEVDANERVGSRSKGRSAEGGRMGSRDGLRRR